MGKIEKVTVMKSRDGLMVDIAQRDVTLVNDDIIRIDMGNGQAVEFKANPMIVAMTHLLMGGGEE